MAFNARGHLARAHPGRRPGRRHTRRLEARRDRRSANAPKCRFDLGVAGLRPAIAYFVDPQTEVTPSLESGLVLRPILDTVAALGMRPSRLGQRSHTGCAMTSLIGRHAPDEP